MAKSTAAQIKTALTTVPDWKKQGPVITRLYQFKDFPASVKFVNAVAHDQGGLIEQDFQLAQTFDRL